MNTDWIHQSFLDNNMDHWLIAIGIIVGGLILIGVVLTLITCYCNPF